MKKTLLIILFLGLSVLLFSDDFLTGDYSGIDTEASRIEEKYLKSIDTMADYINRNFKKEDEKARFIYSWIATHIEYNVKGFFSGNPGNNSAEAVFKNRISVCDGYSELYMSLAKECGLECVKITGHSKGYGFTPGQHFSGDGNHAWNAVKINNKWYLIDSTWGAGYLNDSKKFIFRFTDYFFCTPPEEFIISHFPPEEKWQLLEKPVTLSEFEIMANPEPDYFTNNLNLLNHKTGVINVETETMIAVRADEKTGLMAKLTKDGKDCSDQIFYQYIVDQYQINLLFHTPGKYELQVFAKQKDIDGPYPRVLQFVLNVSQADSESTGFPTVSPVFVDYQCALLNPLERRIPLKTKADFDLIVPQAESVALIYQGEWIFFYKKKGVFYYRNFYSREEGSVRILAKFPDKGDQYWELLEFECY